MLQQVSLVRPRFELPGEVTDFFKRDGKGWQTRLSNTLEEYVQAHNHR